MLVRRGDGDVLRLAPPDAAFHDLNGSFGTLCTLLEAGVRCRPTTGWVKVTYSLVEEPDAGAPAGIEEILSLSSAASPPEYLDALHLPLAWSGYGSPAATVVIRAADVEIGAVSESGSGWRSWVGGLWFYEHCIRIGATLRGQVEGQQIVEFLPIDESYLFRYDYGVFGWLVLSVGPSEMLSVECTRPLYSCSFWRRCRFSGPWLV